MLSITRNAPTPATSAGPRMYPKRFNAQRAAIATLGPEAREGFEFVTIKADGQWYWRKTDEVPPDTQAQCKMNGRRQATPVAATNPTLAEQTEASTYALPNGTGAHPLDVPDDLRRPPMSDDERVRLDAVTAQANSAEVRMPKTVTNPKGGRKARDPHPGDVADLSLIPQATGFVATLFINGGFDKRPAATVDEARRLASDMENISGSTRRALVYALLADGRSILVPASYDPTRPPAAAAKTGKRNKTGTAKTPRARKAPAPRVKGAETKTDRVVKMLSRDGGATRKQIADALDWPTVDLKAIAKRRKMKLTENEGVYRLA